MTTRRRIAATIVAALSMTGIVIGALPATAAAAPAINCIQNPTQNSNNEARFTGTDVRIHTGPSTTCTPVGLGQRNHDVTAHCGRYIATHPPTVTWVYLTDNTTHKTGWSAASLVSWSGTLASC